MPVQNLWKKYRTATCTTCFGQVTASKSHEKWIHVSRKYTADLVSLEKMMHYKRSIIDVLKDVLPELDMDEGRRLTLVEECHERWVENARNLRSGNGRNGKGSGKEVRP